MSAAAPRSAIRFRCCAALTAFSLLAAGCAQQPTGETAFGVLGDTPYGEDEAARLEQVIDAMNAQPLEFVVHVGDIGSSSEACHDDWLLARRAQFARIRHPFILLPGDNEWSDCANPLERLRRWRELFCEVPKEYCEHRRWESHGLVFVTLNVQGSNNNVRHPEHGPRMQVVLTWLEQAAVVAAGKRGLVVLMQGDPFITLPRDGFESLREKLAELGQRLDGKVVLIHGDTHVAKDDEPIPGVRRIEVWGSPIVAWRRLEFSELPSRSGR